GAASGSESPPPSRSIQERPPVSAYDPSGTASEIARKMIQPASTTVGSASRATASAANTSDVRLRRGTRGNAARAANPHDHTISTFSPGRSRKTAAASSPTTAAPAANADGSGLGASGHSTSSGRFRVALATSADVDPPTLDGMGGIGPGPAWPGHPGGCGAEG